jgi:hypothetical protein
MTRKQEITWYEEFGLIIHKIIPYALILLTFVISLELAHTFHYVEYGHAFETWLHMMDYIIIGIFVLDLIYIARRCETKMYFFKNYWLDILAVFPFALMFNVVNEFTKILYFTRQAKIGQSLLHESLEVRKGVSVAARSGQAGRGIRIIARSLRLVSKGVSREK